MENRLKGRIAVVTGATSGIGRSCATELAKLGMNVIITGRRENILQEVKTELKKYDVKCLSLTLDMQDSKKVIQAFANLDKDWQDIDVLINNAGLAFGTEKLYDNDVKEFDAVIDTNVKGAFYVIKAVVPQMVKRQAKGVIVTMGSVAGNAAYAGGAAYCASKAAIKYLSDGLRIDLMDTPIRVTNIEPGLVETGFSVVRFRGDKQKAKAVYTGIEALTPDDIAQTVAYVCSLPENVQLPEVVMTPTHQADALNKHYQN